jgi:hypothetical protein
VRIFKYKDLAYKAGNQSINQPTIHYLFTAKMKGVIFESAGGPLKVVDLPVPEPSPDQILVKSLYTAINPVYVKGFLLL